MYSTHIPKNSDDEFRELDLLVRQSDENITQFDVERIAAALVRETRLTPEIARQLSLEVKAQIQNLKITALTAPLIRGLVDAKLLEHGLIAAHRLHSRLGVPMYDADQIIQGTATESRAAHGPEGTSLTLAEAIKREYAMLAVFSDQVASAHLNGDIHVENLGQVDRLVSMIGTIDFIKRVGISLPGGFSGSRPARRPEVLASHLVKYTAALHGYFSEAIAWDSVNFAFAPFIADLSAEEQKQVAQALLFDLSTPALARTVQPMRCDLHLDWEAPSYLRDRPAIGAGGEALDKTYSEFGEVARSFLTTIIEVYIEGDGQGLPLIGTRPVLHVTSRFIDNPGYRHLLDLVSQAAIQKGGITFSFDRSAEDDQALSTFQSRYGLAPTLLDRANESWQWRAALFSSVAINLPRLAIRSGGDKIFLIELLTELLELAAQASLEKRVFLEKLLARGDTGVLALLAMRSQNEPFLRLNWTTHAICPVGLNELVAVATGSSIENSTEAQEFAAQIMAHLGSETKRLSAKHKTQFILAESRDINAQNRLAKLDIDRLPLHKTADADQVFYTNSAKLKVDNQVAALERLRIEGKLLQGSLFNGVTDLWIENNYLKPEQLAVLISRAFYQTNCAALSFAPSFTLCLSCQSASPGVLANCPACESDKLDTLALSTSHYSRVSTWPTWKIAEFHLRNRTSIT